ncbi:MAG: hypothetical protein RBU36_14215 [Thermoanaerobaculia bacterium]|nr:hypothetical protein [Thermoanaerobaculia bacterium]
MRRGTTRRTRTGFLLAAVAATALLWSRPAAAEWYVVCDVATGAVVMGDTGAAEGREVLAGPFPGERTARAWVEESCPSLRCARGRGCVASAAPTPSAADWLAVCDPATGRVGIARDVVPPGRVALSVADGGPGTHASESIARSWVDFHCPTWRCGDRGACARAGAAAPPAAPPAGTGGGWVAGEVTSVTLSGAEGAGPSTVAAPGPGGPEGPAGSAGPAGPSPADLSPIVETAKAAAAGCSFEAAKMAAEQMKLFDPEDPWLVANLPKLERLAERQRTTEQTVWAANSALSSGDLKRARKLAGTAADNAVSCQSQAVGELVRGIDAAIAAQRQARQAENRRAAAALLPSLVDLSRALSGAAAGPAPARGAGVPPPAYGGIPAPALGVADPCVFQFVYKSKWSVEPVCTCPGYRFDARQFKCVR